MTTQRSNMIFCGLLIISVAVGMMLTLSAQDPNAAVQGVSRTLEVAAPGGRTFRPEPTLAIFHGRHYSRVEVHAEQPRPFLADPATASADQLRAVWGPLVAEAGTFEISATV